MFVSFLSSTRKVVVVAATSALLVGVATLTLGIDNSSAAPVEGTGAGKIVLSPASGVWGSDASGIPVPGTNIQTNFTCPDTSRYLVPFIVEPGSETPTVTTTDLIKNTYALANTGHPISLPDTHFNPDNAGAYFLFDASQFSTPTEKLPDIHTALLANHTYSFGLACAVYAARTLTFALDGGKPVAVWTTLTTDANKNWSTPAAKAETTVKITGRTAGGTENDLNAEVDSSAAGGLATDAKGTIEFFSDGTSIGTSPITGGKAALKHTGLTPATVYRYTAKYVPSASEIIYAPSPLSAEAQVTTANATPTPSATPTSNPSNTATPTPSSSASTSPTSPTPTKSPTVTDNPTDQTSALSNGSVVESGKRYLISAPAGTFTAADSIKGELHSQPIPLIGTATAAADGSAHYTFTAPENLPLGAHQIILTGTPSNKVFTISVTVAGPPPATNNPFKPLTAWAATTASTPGGLASLFAIALGLAAAIAVAWQLIVTRKNKGQH